MSLLLAGALKTLATGALTAVISPFIDEAKEVALNTAQDTVRSIVAGRMSIDEWSSVAIVGVDNVKNLAVSENNLRFVGGKLKFSMSMSSADVVTISFQLYFLNTEGKWQLAEAATDVPVSKFTYEALDELAVNREIVFEVE